MVQGMATAESLARRVAKHGGAALIIDYGQDAPYPASLQAIREHAFVGLLEQPGSADLSARVDFDALRCAVADTGAPAACYGSISQAQLLLSLGIEARLEALLQGASEQQGEALTAGFARLVGSGEGAATPAEEGMGQSYRALCIAPQNEEPPFPFIAAAAPAAPS